MSRHAFQYHRPTSLVEAFRLKAETAGSRYIAGGTDMFVDIRQGSLKTPALVSLRNIPELAGIEVGETTRVGALTPVSDLITHPQLALTHPVLVEAARQMGSVQTRNLATVGGNLCNASPCADLAPPLLALGARVEIVSAQGTREVQLDEFFTGPGTSRLAPDEVLTAIILDSTPPNTKATFIKKGRVAMDLSQVSAAVLLRIENERCVRARIAVGSVAPTPLRLRKVEELLENQRITSETLAKARDLAASEVSPITDVRATAEYRRHMTGVLVERAITKLLGSHREGR